VVTCTIMLRRSDPPVDTIFAFCNLEKGRSLTDARYRPHQYVSIILFRSFCADSGRRICPWPSIPQLQLEEYRVGKERATMFRCAICPYSSIFSGFFSLIRLAPGNFRQVRPRVATSESLRPADLDRGRLYIVRGILLGKRVKFPSIHHGGIHLLAVPIPSTTELRSHTSRYLLFQPSIVSSSLGPREIPGTFEVGHLYCCN
jgi:hypothetical protein